MHPDEEILMIELNVFFFIFQASEPRYGIMDALLKADPEVKDDIIHEEKDIFLASKHDVRAETGRDSVEAIKRPRPGP